MESRSWNKRVAIAVAEAFFFSSRSRHTRALRDWSSDVCSSDLGDEVVALVRDVAAARDAIPSGIRLAPGDVTHPATIHDAAKGIDGVFNCMGIYEQWRSEERRVGKGCRSWRWSSSAWNDPTERT